MVIGSCTIKLRLFESNSLKDKRQIVKSILGRIKTRFNVSIAEIDLNNSWQTTIIGFACVTNDTQHANQIVSNVLRFIDEDIRVEIIEENIEIL